MGATLNPGKYTPANPWAQHCWHMDDTAQSANAADTCGGGIDGGQVQHVSGLEEVQE